MRSLIVAILVLFFSQVAMSADLLPFPPDCDTPGEKMEYSYRAEQLLQDEHNGFVYWRDEGLTQDEYDNGIAVNKDYNIDELTVFGPNLKDSFKYKEFISESEYWDYFNSWFVPRVSRIGSEQSKSKTACKRDPFCTTDYMRSQEGPFGGTEYTPKKDLFKISGKYPVNIDEFPRTNLTTPEVIIDK